MNFTDDSAALFPTMARSNHSCTPNSEFITREKLGNKTIQKIENSTTLLSGMECSISNIII